MSKDSDYKRELEKLKKIFADIPEDKRDLVDGLIENAAFMVVTLRDLQAEIEVNGAMIQTTSGNGFEMLKDNPAQKAYTSMVAKYTAVIAQLDKFLPTSKAQEVAKAGTLLTAFIKAGKPE